jgi:membrane fusion protein (multidrug efflux system)
MSTPETERRETKPSRRKRHTLVACSLVAVLLLGGGGIVLALNPGAATAAPGPVKLKGTTGIVELGDLQGTSKVAGTLAYTDPVDLQSGLGGVVTWLPAAGSQIGQGQPLYTVNDQKAYLLHGSLPAWRAFSSGMDDGPDVKQLEVALAILGYFAGTPDEHFSWSTSQAITAWQKATQQEQTGDIPLGVVLFQPTDVRIAQLKTTVGGQVGPGAPIASITALTKEVQVQLKLTDQQLAKQGGHVQVQLPNGKSAQATIQSVGVPTPQTPSDPNSTTIIPVVVTLDDPSAADGFQQASVVVTFPTETKKNVLSVPLAALIALPGGKYGVQIVNAAGAVHSVPITTGMFAGDRVEVTGDVKAGQKVLVPNA